ncbi:UDP-glucose 4-epimerase GalE [Phenylobacterium sp.]|jgi:UDP-glucose 4-epimerase|uniref:UDP-glucose 4-epimerase GalE n=1 Tax=Phenylobacterium sp. TaxID=1871053 RepID=UPI002F946974
MTVLITGGCGYIGSHVAWALADRGHEIQILDDLSTGHPDNAPPQAGLIVGDVSDPRLLSEAFSQGDVSAVIHLAGKILPAESVKDPIRYLNENTCKTIALLEAMVRAGVRRLVFSSTAAVYGQSEVPKVDEDAATRPMSPYGVSKLMAEQAIEVVCAAHDLRATALRYFNVAGVDAALRCGPRGPNPGHLIRTAIQCVRGVGGPLVVFGDDYETPDGTCLRDYIHVSDLAAAHLSALLDLETHAGFHVFNCGYGNGASVLEVIRTVEMVSGKALPYTVGPRRDGDPPALIADPTRLLETGTWKPTYSLAEIVRSAMHWDDVGADRARALNDGARQGPHPYPLGRVER